MVTLLLLVGLFTLVLLGAASWLLRGGHRDTRVRPPPRRVVYDPTVRSTEYWRMVAEHDRPYREWLAQRQQLERELLLGTVDLPPSQEVQALTANFREQRQITARLSRQLYSDRATGMAPKLPADPPIVHGTPDVGSDPRRLLPLVSVAPPPAGGAPVYFKPGEPQTFAQYAGQDAVVQYLSAAVRGRDHAPSARDPDGLAIPHQLFYGLPGLGKTLLAKVLANELTLDNARRGLGPAVFIEAFPSDIPDVKALDRYLRRVEQAPGCVLFIDEIHDFTEKHLRKLYLVLEEGRYKFEDEPDPVQLPPFTIVGATTDPGEMPAAFKRRFVRWSLKPADPEQLYQYVMGRARGGLPIDEGAADELIAHTHFSGAPWEAIQLYEQAAVFARGDGDTRVRPAHVRQVLASQEIDALGLGWQDRVVLQFLFTQPKYRTIKGVKEFDVYAASEDNVCRMAGVDRGEYRDTIRPKLFARGLLTLHTRGQALTPAAIEEYGHLIPSGNPGAMQ